MTATSCKLAVAGGNWSSNNQDYCPLQAGISGNYGCPSGYKIENRNWIETTVFDINNTLKGASKNYFNDLGKLEQTQSIDLETNRTWASHTFYDSHGRPAVSTLSAPTALNGTFCFQDNFVKDSQGNTYSLSSFENGNDLNPKPVGTAPWTLGWYYSNNNDENFYEGNQLRDITSYPLSRNVFSVLNPGQILKTLGGNKIDSNNNGTIDGDDDWLQSYSFTMPAHSELYAPNAFDDARYYNMDLEKTISRDVHGVENVIFTDKEGLVLATARSGLKESGTQVQHTVQFSLPEQGFIDVHIPEGCIGIQLTGTLPPLDGHSPLKIYDLITENQLGTANASNLAPGFYRIALDRNSAYNPNLIQISHQVNYYDYALNEYDEAGRLTNSYQPLRKDNGEKLETTYTFNALGQLTETTSVDEGTAQFKYREDGQIRFSQNKKQQLVGEFSYTNYDSYARPVESGVLESTAFATANPNVSTLPSGVTKEQQHTSYDSADTEGLPAALGSWATYYGTQSFVAGNVSYTYNDQSKTWYSYDAYGRVKWVVQDITDLGVKTIDYQYHPITGLVTEVVYQKHDDNERFIHKYRYDVKDQLKTVHTGSDENSLSLQAEYFYYETGGLRRVELADGAQGLDYVYNLAGQLKSINHPSLDNSNDPGGDTNDLFGMQLDYHQFDYQRNVAGISTSTYGVDQYNGNIKGIRWNNVETQNGAEVSEYVYEYDRNNWLTGANFNPSGADLGGAEVDLSLNGTITSNQVATQSITLNGNPTIIQGNVTLAIDPDATGISEGDYDVSHITYDANGNIQSLRRNGQGAMDDLSYSYDPNKPNQLRQVEDAVASGANGEDIDTQTDANNYVYNEIGQLIENKAEQIQYFYNASGLVTEVWYEGSPKVKFMYNDRNHRVKKESYHNGNLLNTTYYVRDVAGQVMAIYTEDSSPPQLTEQPIYGAGRIGVQYTNGLAVYELTDHLGNIRAVFTKESATDGNLEGYTDYYPGGMAMPNRNVQGDYRYNYQGQELDEETGKVAFELRLYDPRINRWLTTDPKREFSSPYLAMGNNWVNLVDPDGGSTAEPLDDYRLNDNGTFTHIANTDFADRVFNADGDFVQLEYDGQIADMQSGTYKGGAYDFLTFKNDFIATEAFEFFANNSSVEFSHVISDTKSFVSTSQKPSVEYGGPGIVNDLLYKGKNVLEFNHSHPYKRERLMRLLLTEMRVEGVKKFTPGPSGFDPNSEQFGKGDALSAKSVLKASPNTKLHVYDATVQEYIQYNQHGAVHKN